MRITQTAFIRMTTKHFTQQGWERLYQDLPGGSRSGVGLTAKINAIWEGLFNLSPDAAFLKGDVLLLVEVDKKLGSEYITKFGKYWARREELLVEVSHAVEAPVKKLELGFVSMSAILPATVDNEFVDFHCLYARSGTLVEIVLNPS